MIDTVIVPPQMPPMTLRGVIVPPVGVEDFEAFVDAVPYCVEICVAFGVSVAAFVA